MRCDQEDWMRVRQEVLPEKSHRHPSEWWESRYEWINEAGEPRKPNYKTCGRNVNGLEYMRDEFPEQAPNEATRLKCLLGRKQITLPCIDLTEDDETFEEVAKNLTPSEFLKTQRQKIEEARLRQLTKATSSKSKKRSDRKGLLKLSMTALSALVSLRVT